MEQRDCEWCGYSFTPKSKQSRYCYQTHYNDCSYCGSRFELSSLKRPARFCSTSCATKSNLTIRKIEKNCEFCGDTFNAQRSSERFCSKEHYRECVCGNSFLIVSLRRPAKTCSKKCASTLIDFEDRNSKSEQKWIENYGTKNPSQAAEIKQKKKLTTMDNYGVDNPSRSKEVKERRRATIQERFGVDNAGQSPVVRAKMKKTNLKRYGVENAGQVPHIKDKIKKTILERYGVENIFQLPEVQLRAAASQGLRISKLNQLWKQKLFDSLGVEFEFETLCGGFFSDLGYDNVVIEINPTVSHNTTFPFQHFIGMCKNDPCTKHKLKADNYHQVRALAAEGSKKVMLQYFDWHDEDIFISIVRSKLKLDENRVFARKCELRVIGQPEANRFFRENHLLGASNKQTYCLGLFYKNELVHVQTYGPARISKKAQWEAIRSCSKMNWHIVGAFSKCDAKFIKENDPDSIVSYVDLAISQGSTDSMMPGWRLLSTNKPSATWCYLGLSSQRGNKPMFVRDSTARRISADRALGFEVDEKYPRYDENGLKITNDYVLLSEGYVKVFDAGTRTFMWNKP